MSRFGKNTVFYFYFLGNMKDLYKTEICWFKQSPLNVNVMLNLILVNLSLGPNV